MPDVQLIVLELWKFPHETLLVPARIALWAEKVGTHVIVHAMDIPAKLVEMAHVYRLSDVDRFVHVIVPGTLPSIVTGMKVGFALALIS